jgi:hypothetical protein
MSRTPEADVAAHLLANALDETAVIERILAARTPRELSSTWSPLSGFFPVSAEQFSQALQNCATGIRHLVVSFSHDHYLSVGGGLQNCVGLEADSFVAHGWAYLHLCPNRPLLVLSDEQDPAQLEVLATLNGSTIGWLTVQSLMEALAANSAGAEQSMVVVHQLLGHAPEVVQALVEALPEPAVYFFIHDLFAHCPSIHLLRNNAAFCGGPPSNSSACGICHAGAERPRHLARLDTFFSALQPTLLAPSQTILDVWRRIHTFAHTGAEVLTPCRIERTAPLARAKGPLRIGFLGTAAFHKGWEAFAQLVLWFGDDPRYQFYQLGWKAETLPGLLNHPVDVTPHDRQAMVRGVSTCKLDVVVNWSRCFESFSFTAIEALAGGAFIVARRGAGNVFPLISALDPARGIAVDTVVELQALLQTGDIIDLARQAPRWSGTLVMSQGAAALLAA